MSAGAQSCKDDDGEMHYDLRRRVREDNTMEGDESGLKSYGLPEHSYGCQRSKWEGKAVYKESRQEESHP